MAASSTSTSDSNLMAALSYLVFSITGVIMYLVKPKDKYVKYHAIQSIILGVVLWVISMVVGIGVGIMTIGVPLIGAVIAIAVMGIMYLVFLAIWLYCMWKAYNGEKFKIPHISKLVEKQLG